MITSPAFVDKRYAVLGLARSGLAAVEALAASGARITAWDAREEARDAVADKARLADPLEIDLTGFDGLVVSPGVPLNDHPAVARARDAGVPIIGDIELFSLARPALPVHNVIGITGTNGKSTTTALIAHILSVAGVPNLMAGNIGVPILSRDPLPSGGVYVLELSSYQIDLTQSLDCDVAVLLNLSPDHLDRHGGFDGYIASKERLFAMQSADNVAIIGTDDAASAAMADRVKRAKRITARAIDDQREWPSLQGPHNAQNIAASLAAVEALGVSRSVALAALGSFTGLPHRMEIIGRSNGVTFVNDSKATNTASAAPALAAWPADPEPRIHWILGGLPKGEGLGECEAWLGNVAHAYTVGEAGPMFADALEGRVPVERSEMLGTAVEMAIGNARDGDVILLSPACASFDQFKDFEARGDAFRSLVEARLMPGRAEFDA